jgi:hypothetical protein
MLVQHRRVGSDRGGNIEYRRQRLVIDLDQRQRGLRHMRIHGGDGRDRLPDPVDLAARHVDLRHHPHVVAGLAHRDRGADRQFGKIRRGHHREHAFQRGRARRVDAPDVRMGVRAAQLAREHHSGQRNVRRIARRAGDALARIDPRQPLADHLEGRSRLDTVRHLAGPPAATAAMASTILP